MLVDFEPFVWWWEWPYSYFWDFWDWNNWLWKNIQNIYKQDWVYEVFLLVIDKNWKSWNASALIQVTWNNKCDLDSDNDWIGDCLDLCPLIKWDNINEWCPVLEKKCSTDSNCSDLEYCSTDKNICVAKKITNNCEYTWWDVIFWNVVCNSCPCSNSLDFTSTLRKCDIIFPAITSPDSKNIYSKWELFQIK